MMVVNKTGLYWIIVFYCASMQAALNVGRTAQMLGKRAAVESQRGVFGPSLVPSFDAAADKVLFGRLQNMIKKYSENSQSSYVQDVSQKLLGYRQGATSLQQIQAEEPLTVDGLNDLIRQSVEQSRSDFNLYTELQALAEQAQVIPGSLTYELLKNMPSYDPATYYFNNEAKMNPLFKKIEQFAYDPSFKNLVNAIDSKGQTPLTALFSYGPKALNHAQIVNLLIDAGADPSKQDDNGMSPVQIIVQKVADQIMLPNQGARILNWAKVDMAQPIQGLQTSSGLEEVTPLGILTTEFADAQNDLQETESHSFAGARNEFITNRATEGVVETGLSNDLMISLERTPIEKVEKVFERIRTYKPYSLSLPESADRWLQGQMKFNPLVQKVIQFQNQQAQQSALEKVKAMRATHGWIQKPRYQEVTVGGQQHESEKALSEKAQKAFEAQQKTARTQNFEKSEYQKAIERVMREAETGFLD